MSPVRVLTGSHIRVSKNTRIDCGMFFDLQLHCIFPLGRKAHRSTFTVSAGAVTLAQLREGRAGAAIAPNDFRELVAKIPVRSDTLAPVTMTPEIEAQARAYFSQFSETAERQLLTAHPNFRPSLVPVQFIQCAMNTNEKLKVCGLDKRDAVGYSPTLGIKDVFQTIAPANTLFTGRATDVDEWVEYNWPNLLLSHREEKALAE